LTVCAFRHKKEQAFSHNLLCPADSDMDGNAKKQQKIFNRAERIGCSRCHISLKAFDPAAGASASTCSGVLPSLLRIRKYIDDIPFIEVSPFQGFCFP
jgi:hypothetical protein